jgi:hypothetical protein
MHRDCLDSRGALSLRMKNKFTLFLIVVPLFSFSQTWQWARQGGSTDNMGVDNPYIEQAKSIAADRNGNVYVISPIGLSGPQVSGVPKKTFNANLGRADYIIAKFGCSGDYKWSRVIGGNDSDTMQRVFADSLGNVYAAGMVFRNSSTYPVKFGGEGLTDIDTVLPFGSGNQNKRGLYLVKYDSIGSMKWLRMPQPADISPVESFGQSWSADLSVDQGGNCYWLTWIPPGTYADGAFVNTTPASNLFVFKYGAQGNFIGAVRLMMDVLGPALADFKMVRNHENGNIYIAGTANANPSANDYVSIGGESVTHRMYVAAFDQAGNLLWKKENTNVMNFNGMEDICLDAQGNIYVTGGTGIPDSFNGNALSSPTGHMFPFLIKLNPAGDTLWQTNATTTNISFGAAVTINGDEVAVTGGYGNMQWGGNALAVQPNAGYDVFLARFNKNTGAMLGLHSIPNNFGGEEFGTAIAADASGNYLLGGRFSSFLYAGTSSIQNVGQQSDFFIAKFGNATCGTLSDAEYGFATVLAYPNPSSGALNITASFSGSYRLYNLYGVELQSGQLLPDRTPIDISKYPSGIYLLHLHDHNGNKKVLKVVRE